MAYSKIRTERIVMDKNAIIKSVVEGIKEVGRIAFFAAITAAVGWASNKLGGLDPSSTFYVVGTLVLRFVDKYVHVNEGTTRNGISPF